MSTTTSTTSTRPPPPPPHLTYKARKATKAPARTLVPSLAHPTEASHGHLIGYGRVSSTGQDTEHPRGQAASGRVFHHPH